MISSDFSHYPLYKDAISADRATAEAIKSNKASALLSALQNNEKKEYPGLVTSLCGWSSALCLLYMTEQIPDLNVDLLQYKNSGNSPYGDKERVVGYWGISFSKDSEHKQDSDFSLSDNDKKYLLNLARETITEFVGKGMVPVVNTVSLSQALKTPCGAFVTLNKNNRLRAVSDDSMPVFPCTKSYSRWLLLLPPRTIVLKRYSPTRSNN